MRITEWGWSSEQNKTCSSAWQETDSAGVPLMCPPQIRRPLFVAVCLNGMTPERRGSACWHSEGRAYCWTLPRPPPIHPPAPRAVFTWYWKSPRLKTIRLSSVSIRSLWAQRKHTSPVTYYWQCYFCLCDVNKIIDNNNNNKKKTILKNGPGHSKPFIMATNTVFLRLKRTCLAL